MIALRYDELASNVGLELGPSACLTIHQADIDAFAAVTGDDQWLRTEPTRAVSSGQAGALAHGLLTLSLWPVEGLARTVNDVLDRCRFPASVLAGARCAFERLWLRPLRSVTGRSTLRSMRWSSVRAWNDRSASLSRYCP